MTSLNRILFGLLVMLLAACATKPAPHKLTTSAPGDNGAPTTTTW